MKLHKTTDEQYRYFRDCVREYLEEFRIDDWAVQFEFGESSGSNATCTINIDARIVTFLLATRIRYTENSEIKDLALHEVCHLLLSDVTVLIGRRFITDNQIEQACESVARKVQSLLRKR